MTKLREIIGLYEVQYKYCTTCRLRKESSTCKIESDLLLDLDNLDLDELIHPGDRVYINNLRNRIVSSGASGLAMKDGKRWIRVYENIGSAQISAAPAA